MSVFLYANQGGTAGAFTALVLGIFIPMTGAFIIFIIFLGGDCVGTLSFALMWKMVDSSNKSNQK